METQDQIIHDCHRMRERHARMDADLLARLARVRADFPAPAFTDYEVDVRELDRWRDFWHGLLVFVAVIAIASLFACERGPTYSPELSNALTLSPFSPDSSLGIDGPPRPPKPKKEAPKPDASGTIVHTESGSTIRLR